MEDPQEDLLVVTASVRSSSALLGDLLEVYGTRVSARSVILGFS